MECLRLSACPHVPACDPLIIGVDLSAGNHDASGGVELDYMADDEVVRGLGCQCPSQLLLSECFLVTLVYVRIA